MLRYKGNNWKKYLKMNCSTVLPHSLMPSAGKLNPPLPSFHFLDLSCKDERHDSSRNSSSDHSKVSGLSIYWVSLTNVAERFSIFFSCRKYLLRIFYSDLHSLSLSSPSSSVPGTPGEATTSINTHKNNELAEEIQLDSLPLPSTAPTPRSPHFILEDPTYLHAAVSRIMFSWCFTESCMMFFLLMLQAFGIFSATWVIQTSVALFWHFRCLNQCPAFKLAILLVLYSTFHSCYNTLRRKPFLDHRQSRFAFNPHMSIWLIKCHFTDHRKSQWPIIKARFFLSLVPVITYLFAFSHIPLPAGLASSDTTTIALSRLIVLGTIILGLLSGFGVISNSWRFLPFISQSRYVSSYFFPWNEARGWVRFWNAKHIYILLCLLNRGIPSEQELDAAQYSLTSIRNDMRSRREEAARREGPTVRVLSIFHHNPDPQDLSGRIDFMVLPRRILISRRW